MSKDESKSFVEEANKETAVEAPVADTPTETPVVASAAASNEGTKKIARILLELVLLAAIVFLSLWAVGLQSKNKDLQKQVDTLNSNPVVAEQKKTNELVGKVGALMQLPIGENPQAAQVTDPDALKKQYAFFTDVQKGDQVLFYIKAGKVIVYRPSTGKIVQTGPLSVNQAPTEPTATTKSTSTR